MISQYLKYCRPNFQRGGRSLSGFDFWEFAAKKAGNGRRRWRAVSGVCPPGCRVFLPDYL